MLFGVQLKGPYFGAVAVTFLLRVVFSLSLPHSLTCFCQRSYSSLSGLFHLLTLRNASPSFQVSRFSYLAPHSSFPWRSATHRSLFTDCFSTSFTVSLSYAASYGLFIVNVSSHTAASISLHIFTTAPTFHPLLVLHPYAFLSGKLFWWLCPKPCGLFRS